MSSRLAGSLARSATTVLGARRAPPPARVMIVDDSAVIRAAISNVLVADPGINVVARHSHGQAALEALRTIEVDVIVLDIEMPVMDGLTALPLLLAASPGVAIIMASTLTTRGAEISLRALRMGAADTLAKPTAADLARDQRFGPELVAKVLGLARARQTKITSVASQPSASLPQTRPTLRPMPQKPARLLAIGSSTGGPNALFALLGALPRGLRVPVIITQHMPPTFVPILAEHLHKLGVLPCSVAEEGVALRPGHVFIAPGDRHLLIRRHGAELVVELSDAPAEQFCRPAVDPMLRSASDATDGRLLAAILTGMGSDGLAGARHLVAAGGAVVAQDEASSVVWGMPGAVTRAGLACAVVPLSELAGRLASLVGCSTPGAYP